MGRLISLAAAQPNPSSPEAAMVPIPTPFLPDHHHQYFVNIGYRGDGTVNICISRGESRDICGCQPILWVSRDLVGVCHKFLWRDLIGILWGSCVSHKMADKMVTRWRGDGAGGEACVGKFNNPRKILLPLPVNDFLMYVLDSNKKTI